MQFIYETLIQVTYYRTLISIPFCKSVNLHQYISNNNPQATTGNQTTSDQISEVGTLGSQVEFKRLGKTYTTNLIHKHRLAYPTYKLHITLQLFKQRKEPSTILKWVVNIWTPLIVRFNSLCLTHEPTWCPCPVQLPFLLIHLFSYLYSFIIATAKINESGEMYQISGRFWYTV
jgi:hypothetical protein